MNFDYDGKWLTKSTVYLFSKTNNNHSLIEKSWNLCGVRLKQARATLA